MGCRIIHIPRKTSPEPDFYPVEYGLLYNWPAATDARNIAASGWHVPTNTDRLTLFSYLVNVSTAGAKLKEAGLSYWTTPNTGATNEYLFNGRGAGFRFADNGLFGDFNTAFHFHLNNTSGSNSTALRLSYNSTTLVWEQHSKLDGNSIRLIKDSTTLSHGQEGIYTGNDGKGYRTICIGNQEWLADNLCETRFQNDDIIPWHGATPANYFTNTEWAALTTPGVCAYGNILSNVAPGFTFAT